MEGLNPAAHSAKSEAKTANPELSNNHASGAIDPSARPKLEITYRYITDKNDSAFVGFIDTYREAFSGPPYFENFSSEDVKKVWDDHLADGGCVVVAEIIPQGVPEAEPRVIGLACAHKLCSPLAGGAGEFILAQHARGGHAWTPESTMYISELACRNESRGNGEGTTLNERLLQWGRNNGFQDWVTRTAADGSNSLRIFERAGGARFGDRHDVEHEGVETQSKQRVYLAGSLLRVQ